MKAVRHSGADPDLDAVLDVMRRAFQDMEGRIDPPSSIHAMTLETLQASSLQSEVWSLGAPVKAAVILTPTPTALYIGKLAVDRHARGRGLARRLIDLADARARALGLARLSLQARIELQENHSVFSAMGFERGEDETHTGYARPTSVWWHRKVSPNVPHCDEKPAQPN